jgi:hypothetical protein
MMTTRIKLQQIRARLVEAGQIIKRKEVYKLTFYSGVISPELSTQTEQNLIERGLIQHPNQIHQIGEVTLKKTVDDLVIEDMGSVTENQVRPVILKAFVAGMREFIRGFKIGAE